MKVIYRLLTNILILLFCLPASAADVSLAWDPSSSTGVVGYKVYKGIAAGVYETPITIGNQTGFTLTGLGPGTWYFTVTAIDAEGNESDYATSKEDPTKRYVSKTISSTGVPILTIAAIQTISVPAITTTYATIAWTTNIECAGVVFYGTAEPLTKSVTANNLATTDHLAVLGPLTTRTHYLFKVRSKCNDSNIDGDLRSFNTK
jgi:hypothetical protein